MSKATSHLDAAGYKVKRKKRKKRGELFMIEATSGREFTGWKALLLFILGILPFFIYWFTRKKNKIIVTVREGEFKGRIQRFFTIEYDGKKTVAEAERLHRFLRQM